MRAGAAAEFRDVRALDSAGRLSSHKGVSLILRRLAEGARARDWFAVSLELLIVVLGIFLGLRADAWNEARLNRAEEAAYLDRLDQDLAETLSLLRSELHQLNAWFGETVSLASALRTGVAGQEHARAHRAAFAQSTRVLIGRAQLATITELVEGGQLSLISDPEIRAAIAASQGLTESRRLQLQVLSRQQQVLAEIIRPYYSFEVRADGSWSAIDDDVIFDWSEAAGNPQLIRALSQAAENIRVNRLWLEEVIVEMTALQTLLASRSEAIR